MSETVLSSSRRGPRPGALHFGAFVKMVRHRSGIRQQDVLKQLSGWTQTAYSRLESGELAPAFDQLVTIYTALHEAGATLSAQDRQEYLTLARGRIEVKKSHLDRKTDQQWEVLRVTLSQFDHHHTHPEQPTPPSVQARSHPTLMETRHLIGREDWLASVRASVEGPLPKKIVVLQGPTGIGKSSELHRIAQQMLLAPSRPHVILCVLPPLEQHSEPDHALDLVLASLLTELGPPDAASLTVSRSQQIDIAFTHLTKGTRQVFVCVDNAEHLLDERGQFAPCWEAFLKQFLRRQHHATLLLATKEWPGWYAGERTFVTERMIPPLNQEEGASVLHRLGFEVVAEELLHRITETVGGIPLCLEWVASLIKEPLWADSWETVDDFDGSQAKVEKVRHLLDDPVLFQGPIADRLIPLLARITEQRLSAEALDVLQVLSLANTPLGKSALQTFCPRPSLLKELRNSSLLMHYSQRIQLLPMVASVIQQQLVSDQRYVLEKRLIRALTKWLGEGDMSTREAGHVVTELAGLLLNHHKLLDAAQLLIPYSSICFNLGYAKHLARLTDNVMQQMDWQATKDTKCGGFLLHYLLAPFIGQQLSSKQRLTDYQYILAASLEGDIKLRGEMEEYVISQIMVSLINEGRFDEAQALLDTCCTRKETSQLSNSNLQRYLLELRVWLFGAWCDYLETRDEQQKARQLRTTTIQLYRQYESMLVSTETASLITDGLLKTRLARCYNELGYHLARNGQYEEALQFIEQSIVLKEQGYRSFGTLAASYGEKSEILVELGRFNEALHFDEKAMKEVEYCASTGHISSQEEKWLYQANRGRLYLQIGKVVEAEHLLRDAIPHISNRRRIYKMFAEHDLNIIEQWRSQTTTPQYQLDWRWVERYRELCAYDAYWWWASAGAFTEEEQQRWNQSYSPHLSEETKHELNTLIAQSRGRELTAALAEQREPRLHFPALDINDVRRRIEAFQKLDSDISQQEPNVIVRRLYHESIAEELFTLYTFVATYEGDNNYYWSSLQKILPAPTPEEMEYPLSQFFALLGKGLAQPEADAIAQELVTFCTEHLHLIPNIAPDENHDAPIFPERSVSSSSQHLISPQAAKRFFETVFHEYGYTDWRVVIDPNAQSARVEYGLRQLFLMNAAVSVEYIRHLVSHELACHVARCVAGDRSLLGLLGIHTRNASEIDEGLAVYYERQTELLRERPYNDISLWSAMLAVGLASGAVTPPQTFYSLFTFFKSFYILNQFLYQPKTNLQTIQDAATKYALSFCLRTFRGVPDLTQAGICFTKDALYLRGLRSIERVVEQDVTILNRLAVGKVALEYLPDLQELGIIGVPQPLRQLANDPMLDEYIRSFDE